ncbi:hypothetical protein [Kitasatospora sp. NPDC097691]|uniref:hypothetical protein n=1 Tax=Kitasatospora sp. NPDC097691 TaxID=3157231 RepID=UPI0033326775
MGFIEGPRRVVRPGPAAAPPGRASAAPARTTRSGATADQLRPRHADLLKAVRRLDAGLDPAACAELSDWLQEHYRTAYGDVPLGFLATCYLGPPYVDHQLDLFRAIVQHFAPGDRLPEPFGAARMIVRTGAYAYVEVYSGGLVLPVLQDGSVVRP